MPVIAEGVVAAESESALAFSATWRDDCVSSLELVCPVVIPALDNIAERVPSQHGLHTRSLAHTSAPQPKLGACRFALGVES